MAGASAGAGQVGQRVPPVFPFSDSAQAGLFQMEVRLEALTYFAEGWHGLPVGWGVFFCASLCPFAATTRSCCRKWLICSCLDTGIARRRRLSPASDAGFLGRMAFRRGRIGVLAAKCGFDGVESGFRRQNGLPTRAKRRFVAGMAVRRAGEACFFGRMPIRRAGGGGFYGRMSVRRAWKGCFSDRTSVRRVAGWRCWGRISVRRGRTRGPLGRVRVVAEGTGASPTAGRADCPTGQRITAQVYEQRY